jgi:hypothetical protein
LIIKSSALQQVAAATGCKTVLQQPGVMACGIVHVCLYMYLGFVVGMLLLPATG